MHNTKNPETNMGIDINTVLCLIPILLLLLLRRYLRPSNKPNNLPPGPVGLPIIGSLHKLGPSPHEYLYDMSKCYGPLFILRLGSVLSVVTSSPQVARELLQKNDQNFADRPVPDAITAQPNPEYTLAWVPGNSKWRNRRRLCSTQLFASQSLDKLQLLRHEKYRQLVRHIKVNYCPMGKPVDIGQVAFGTTVNLMSSTIFSQDMVDTEFDTAQEFKELVWRIMEDAGKPNLSDYFPAIRRFDLQGIKRHIKPSYTRLHEIFEGVIEKRLQERASASDANPGRRDDFLDVLLDQCQDVNSELDRENIKPLILDLFIAGTDTSAITTEWAMAELIRSPATLRKVKEEITTVIGTQNPVQESDVGRLPYLQAVVKETMRLHPAAPLLLPYRSKMDIEVQGGYVVPKGAQVLVNAWAIGRDPGYWDKPMSFVPERFLGSSLDYKGQDFEYIPFGAGRRICPGWPLAARMVHLMVASLLQSFEWNLPEAMSPEDLDMREQFGVTLRKAVPLQLVPSAS